MVKYWYFCIKREFLVFLCQASQECAAPELVRLTNTYSWGLSICSDEAWTQHTSIHSTEYEYLVQVNDNIRTVRFYVYQTAAYHIYLLLCTRNAYIQIFMIHVIIAWPFFFWTKHIHYVQLGTFRCLSWLNENHWQYLFLFLAAFFKRWDAYIKQVIFDKCRLTA